MMQMSRECRRRIWQRVKLSFYHKERKALKSYRSKKITLAGFIHGAYDSIQRSKLPLPTIISVQNALSLDVEVGITFLQAAGHNQA